MTDKAISKAASWLATTSDAKKPHPIIPHLRKAYGLGPKEAVAAIQKSHLIKTRAH